MKVEELRIRNFRSVEKADFEFGDGMIVFCGDNGQGKSTAFHAMLILLFNSYEGNLKDYIKWGTDKFDISVVFSHGGKRYFEQLMYSEAKGSERVLKDLATNEEWENSAAISRLASILNPDIAKASIVSMENEQNLITTTSAKRREYLKQIYDLEFTDELAGIAAELAEAKDDTAKLDSRLAVLSSLLFKHMEKAELPFDEATYDANVKELGSLREALVVMKEQESAKAQLTKKIYELGSKIDKAETEIAAKLAFVENINKELNNKKEQLPSVKEANSHKDLDEELANLELTKGSERAKLRSELESVKAEIASLDKPNPVDVTLSQRKSDLNVKLSTLAYRKTDVSSKLKVMSSGKCPTCGHEITDSELEACQHEMATIEAEHEAMTGEYASVLNEISKIEDNIDDYESKFRALNVKKELLESKYASADREYFTSKSIMETNVRSYNESVDRNVERFEESIKSLEDKLATHDEMLKSMTTAKIELDGEYVNAHEQLAKFNTIDISPITENIASLEARLKLYDSVVQKNKYIDSYNAEADAKAEANEIEIKSVESELAKRRAYCDMLEASKKILSKEFPSFVISKMVVTLKNYVNEFLAKVYDKYSIDIKESKKSLDIIYGDNGQDVKLASGFEKSAFSLAYMYALGKIQHYGMLMIDEGDAAASEKNSLKFYDTLGKAQEYFPQIFAITHKAEVTDMLKSNYNAHAFTVSDGVYTED